MQKNDQVVVIGAGLGGLSAAISLAESGYLVSVYEKNNHVGGKLNLLEQSGFRFDLGPSILTMPHVIEHLFRRAGKNMADYLKIKRLDLEWRSFFPDGTMIDLYGDLARMAAENPNLAADDLEQYRQFLEYARSIYDITEEGYFKRGFDYAHQVFFHHGLVRAYSRFDYRSTMYEAIARKIEKQSFRDMLAFFVKYAGSSPYDAPAVLNMMIYMQHAQGLWYVPGGMSGIAYALQRLARELGVHFYTGREVVRLETGSGRVTALELADGERVQADIFVSNMEVVPAHEKLLAEPEFVLQKLRKMEPACSGLVLHLGVSKLYPQLAHHNFFFSADPEHHFTTVFRRHQLPDDPTLHVVNVNKTDPVQARSGHENLKILAHIPYIQKQPFIRDDYLALRERVLVKLERMGLQSLRQHIVTEDMWTPDDIEHLYCSDRGAIYGVVSDKAVNKGFKHPKKSHRYQNLYFVGGTVNPGGGMPMVTWSGQQADRLIRKHHPLSADRDR